MRSLTRDGQPLVVHDSGGSGPAILMLLGLAGHAGEFETIAAPLRETHRVLLLDQRGSLLGDMSRQAYADDALFVLRRLGIEQTVLCGQPHFGQSHRHHHPLRRPRRPSRQPHRRPHRHPHLPAVRLKLL
ncbi:alpha/beta fold hydrolase [Catelliglobosispora koreensis]|uniref:alpha/beta fold hydrolase n=1 Tax=Catelliglobosispora koreensis TaxID=129052 RepID=UPI0012F71BAE|nr:alpha/beta hydrolase [Catelliglobosispora koreensis]